MSNRVLVFVIFSSRKQSVLVISRGDVSAVEVLEGLLGRTEISCDSCGDLLSFHYVSLREEGAFHSGINDQIFTTMHEIGIFPLRGLGNAKALSARSSNVSRGLLFYSYFGLLEATARLLSAGTTSHLPRIYTKLL